MPTTQPTNQNDNLIRIHFYSVVESPTNSVLAAARTLCSLDEQARIARYATNALRHRARIARCATRHALAQYVGTPAHTLQFATTNHGKPYLTHPQRGEWTFSITHTATWVAIAIGQTSAVGLDLEDLPARQSVPRDIRALLTTAEAAWMDDAAPDPQAHADRGTRLWTIKEALLKCHGTGLLVPASTVSVELHGAAPTVTAVHEHPPAPDTPPRTWAIQPLPDDTLATLSAGHATPLGVGCIAALTVSQHPVTQWLLHPHEPWWRHYTSHSDGACPTPPTPAPITLTATPPLRAT